MNDLNTWPAPRESAAVTFLKHLGLWALFLVLALVAAASRGCDSAGDRELPAAIPAEVKGIEL